MALDRFNDSKLLLFSSPSANEIAPELRTKWNKARQERHQQRGNGLHSLFDHTVTKAQTQERAR